MYACHLSSERRGFCCSNQRRQRLNSTGFSLEGHLIWPACQLLGLGGEGSCLCFFAQAPHGLTRFCCDVPARMQDVIKNGSEFNKFMSILFLRLTPVVPFSASNYVLGLSPVGFLPFFTGTAAGMAPWAILFASLGSAGRQLLDGGEEFSEVNPLCCHLHKLPPER